MVNENINQNIESNDEITNNKTGLTIIRGKVLKVSACRKTLNVLSERGKKNLKFKKTFKVRKKYAVHNNGAKGEVSAGDLITFYACPPISKTKKWTLNNIVKRGKI